MEVEDDHDALARRYVPEPLFVRLVDDQRPFYVGGSPAPGVFPASVLTNPIGSISMLTPALPSSASLNLDARPRRYPRLLAPLGAYAESTERKPCRLEGVRHDLQGA